MSFKVGGCRGAYENQPDVSGAQPKRKRVWIPLDTWDLYPPSPLYKVFGGCFCARRGLWLASLCTPHHYLNRLHPPRWRIWNMSWLLEPRIPAEYFMLTVSMQTLDAGLVGSEPLSAWVGGVPHRLGLSPMEVFCCCSLPTRCTRAHKATKFGSWFPLGIKGTEMDCAPAHEGPLSLWSNSGVQKRIREKNTMGHLEL